MSVFKDDRAEDFAPSIFGRAFSMSDTPLLFFTTSVQGPDLAIDGEPEPGEQLQEVQLGGNRSLQGGKLPVIPRTAVLTARR